LHYKGVTGIANPSIEPVHQKVKKIFGISAILKLHDDHARIKAGGQGKLEQDKKFMLPNIPGGACTGAQSVVGYEWLVR
jgi:hypothetical protein